MARVRFPSSAQLQNPQVILGVLLFLSGCPRWSQGAAVPHTCHLGTGTSVAVVLGHLRKIAGNATFGVVSRPLVDQRSPHIVRRWWGLAGTLRRAISCTSLELGLEPGVGTGPSSTVAAMQIYTVTNEVEFLVLGDSTVIVCWRTGAYTPHTDDRMSELELAESREYRDRLKSGHGYDDQHREILRRLQIAERAHRNKPDGYWFAEAALSAAYRALRVIYSLDDVDWGQPCDRRCLRRCPDARNRPAIRGATDLAGTERASTPVPHLGRTSRS